MRQFEPTLGIKDTAKNANTFIKQHMPIFWDILKPLAPYILVLTLLDVAITYTLMPIDKDIGKPYDFSLGNLLTAYFFTCLAITWHRVVIHGPDKYEAMNPLKPKKSELAFIGMGIGLSLIYVLFCIVAGLAISLTALPILPLMLILITVFALFIWTKLMFYFPSKATENNISLKKSYEMTKGYVWKMIASALIAYLKLFFICIGYIVLGFMTIAIISLAAGMMGFNKEIVTAVLETIIIIPIILYFQPLFTIIWVTILSNYYQHALQNKGVPE